MIMTNYIIINISNNNYCLYNDINITHLAVLWYISLNVILILCKYNYFGLFFICSSFHPLSVWNIYIYKKSFIFNVILFYHISILFARCFLVLHQIFLNQLTITLVGSKRSARIWTKYFLGKFVLLTNRCIFSGIWKK